MQERLADLFPDDAEIYAKVEIEKQCDRVELTEPSVERHSLYRISLLDSPGALWSICTLIASYGGSIRFLCLNPPDDSVSLGPTSISQPRPAASELLVDLGPSWLIEGEDAKAANKEDTHDLATFEYQLRSLHSVHAVH